MERLTVRNSEGIGVLKQPFECERCGDLQWSLPDLGNGSPIDKLAEYEDLEEQGKLLKLSCVVGDTVYTNCSMKGWHFRKSGRPYAAEVAFIRINSTGGFINVEIGAGHMMQFQISDLGKRFFLTRESAEAALKELGGKKV